MSRVQKKKKKRPDDREPKAFPLARKKKKMPILRRNCAPGIEKKPLRLRITGDR